MNFPYYCNVISLLKKPTTESMLQNVTNYYTAYRKKPLIFVSLHYVAPSSSTTLM